LIQTASQPLWQHTGLRQFIKFCLIGATSAIIDVGLFTVLTHLHLHPILARTLSVFVAVINGYTWNSLWTFRGMGKGKEHEKFMKFLAINVVGMGLNLGIMQGVFFLFTGHFLRTDEPDKLHMYSGLAVAIVLVSLWNFIANKKWTFAHPVQEAQ